MIKVLLVILCLLSFSVHAKSDSGANASHCNQLNLDQVEVVLEAGQVNNCFSYCSSGCATFEKPDLAGLAAVSQQKKVAFFIDPYLSITLDLDNPPPIG